MNQRIKFIEPYLFTNNKLNQNQIMYEQDPVRQISRIPVKDQDRIRTDFFCTLCNTTFVILLFIISIAVYNNKELVMMSLPNDSIGNICGYGVADGFTILYYPDIKDPLKRVCVAKCPTKSDKKVDCYPGQNGTCSSLLPVQTDTQFERTRIGLFCFPTDPTQKQILLDNIGISKRYHFMGVYDAMWRSFYISSILSIVFVALVQFFPKKVVPWTMVVGGLFSLIFGLLTMLFSTGSIVLRVLFFIVCVGITAGCAYTLFNPKRVKEVFVCAQLMEVSTIVLRENLLTLVYVPLFIGFLFLLLVLAGFEVLAAWSFSTFVFQENYPFYDLKGFGNHLLQFLIFVEFIWGLCFLKEAANFCVSGVATQWYFNRKSRPEQIKAYQPFVNLVRFHWGSVLGCALLTATLYVIDYILDFMLNTDSSEYENRKEYESLHEEKSYYDSRTPLDFFNLCRSQTMSYINLVSIPYCNAARYCEQLSSSSTFFDYSQSTTRTYRLAAHAMIVSVVTFISVMTVKSYSGKSDIDGILYVAMIALFTITFFVGLHGDMADGLMISAFVEEGYELDRGGSKKLSIPPEEMKRVYDEDIACSVNPEIEKRRTLSALLLG